jgi:hypothetical protein
LFGGAWHKRIVAGRHSSYPAEAETPGDRNA